MKLPSIYFTRPKSCLLYLIFCGVLLTANCLRSRADYREVIMFGVIGNRSFQDYIYTIEMDGSQRKKLLDPSLNRSYIAASGSSLQSTLTITAHENNGEGATVDHLYLYRPSNKGWQRLLTTNDGVEGSGVISHDNSRVVFSLAGNTRPVEYRLWLIDLSTQKTRQLSNDEEGTWDAYPSWSPDDQEITFLRFRQSPEGPISRLIRLPAAGGKQSVLLGESEGATGMCYAPDGKHIAVWTREGIELMDILSGQRKVILPWSNLPGYRFSAGAISWSRYQDRIAFSMHNTQSNGYELWTVSSSGSDAKKIYSDETGRIHSVSFIQR